MKIKIFDNIIELENKVDSIELIFEEINKLSQSKNYYLESIIIDEKELYENIQEYLYENIEDIKFIEVNLKSKSDFIEELIYSIQEYISNVESEIKNLSEEFYKGIKENTWDKFQVFLESLNFIYRGIDLIDRNIKDSSLSKTKYENWNDFIAYSAKLNEVFLNLEEAIENKDYVLIGDILLYEITEVFEEMKIEITKIIGKGDNNHDIH